MVFVNPEKLERAKHIFDLLTGKQPARNTEEQERLANYTRVATADKIDLTKEAVAVEAFYRRLGGLVRTAEEHKAAEAKKEESRQKGKKDKFGLRK